MALDFILAKSSSESSSSATVSPMAKPKPFSKDAASRLPPATRLSIFLRRESPARAAAISFAKSSSGIASRSRVVSLMAKPKAFSKDAASSVPRRISMSTCSRRGRAA